MISLAVVLTLWHWTGLGVTLVAGLSAVVHVLLYKRDPRSAAFWLVIVGMIPLLGSVMYLLFGINLIRRQARQLGHDLVLPALEEKGVGCGLEVAGETVVGELAVKVEPGMSDVDCMLAGTLDRVSRFPFVEGNEVRVLKNGDEAFPRILEAVRGAQKSVTLASYIFESTGVGALFVEALADAVGRGVEVRVMVDDAGTRYGWPPVTRELRRRGVLVRRFMPNRFITRLITLNLRNHRKVLVVDGVVGFTGGMNIRQGNMLKEAPAHAVQDLHFEVRGPVVAQLQMVFAEDWLFCSGELLGGEVFFPRRSEEGGSGSGVVAIGLPDGPDADVEVMPTALLAALNAAKRRVCIATPYFLPSPILQAAMTLCAVRGVEVVILTPARNNIPVVSWAARTLYPGLLAKGCRIFESPPPFDHSKLFLIDDHWCFVGSTNWDPRSLRLNFEFNLACYGVGLSGDLRAEFDRKLGVSQEVTLAQLEAQSLGARLRNGVARLFIPLL
jgi:cardiolipin synthase